jgi:hypothetical protein
VKLWPWQLLGAPVPMVTEPVRSTDTVPVGGHPLPPLVWIAKLSAQAAALADKPPLPGCCPEPVS